MFGEQSPEIEARILSRTFALNEVDYEVYTNHWKEASNGTAVSASSAAAYFETSGLPSGDLGLFLWNGALVLVVIG